MGWSFSMVDIGRKAHIESLTTARHFSPGYVPLERRVVGNHVWQLVQDPDGRKFISLDLIAKERNGGWGNKGMSETAGPYVYDCPLALLDKADPPQGYAVEWREKVRAHHVAKKALRSKSASLKAGDVIQYGPHEYRLHGLHPFRNGSWSVTRLSDGCMFSMSVRQINTALKSAVKEAA